MAKRDKGTPRQAARPSPPRKFPVLPVVFSVLAALLVAAILFSGGSKTDEERIAEAAGSPVVTGQGLSQFITPASDSAIGQIAPTVTGTDYDDRTVSIADDGTPKVILFLAHWCPHCQAEVTRIQQWLDTTGGFDGVDLISVATAYNPARGNWSPRDWLEGEGWTVPLIRDDPDYSTYIAYGAGDFPYWVFLAGDGTVALRTSGEMAVSDLESIMTQLRDA